MQTSPRQYFVLGLLALALSFQISFSQITSKSTGGRWSDPATWVGGALPSQNTDVVIAGPVIFNNGDTPCKNLTVNAGASLYNYTCYYCGTHILTIYGNVLNNGTMRNEGGLPFILRIKGNVINNGAWSVGRTEFTGSGSQTLSVSGSGRFDGALFVDTIARPTMSAVSDLAFGGSFDLGKTALDMRNFAVSLCGTAGNISNGSILNAKDVIGVPLKDQYGNATYPIIDNITYDGNPNIKGRVVINMNVTLKGNITVSDTVEEKTGYYDYEKTLVITGNITNNGIIRSMGRGLVLNVSGNITNNSRWVHARTEMSGTSDQTLMLGTGKLFESFFKVTDSLGMIAAGSNLAFSGGFDLRKCIFDMKTYGVSLQGSGANIYNGTVKNARDISGVPSKDQYGNATYPIIDNIAYEGNPNVKGRVLINTNVTLKGNITVTDTVEEKTGYYDYEKTLLINGNIVNNGILRSMGRGLVMNVSGNITNNGKWTNARTELSGSSDQTLVLGAGKLFESTFKVTDSLGLTIAASNLAFTAGFDLVRTTLDMRNFAVSFYGTAANISNGNILNTKDVIGVPSKDQYGNATYPIIENITYDGNPNIKGRVIINSNVTLKGNITVTDTVEEKTGYYEYEKTLLIKGNITNNGITRSLSRGLVLNITGNLTNNGKWTHARTELSGTSDQTLILGAGKLFESSFKVTDSLGMIVAGSNLVFSGGFDLRKCVLDMKTYGVTLQGFGANIYNGIVINARDLIGKQVGDIYGTPIIDNITYNGSISLRGIMRVNSGTMQGDVTIIDTIQNSSGYGHPEKFLIIVGNVTNKGLVQDGGSSGFVLDVTGNVTATKAFVNKRIQLGGTGNRTIVDKVSTLSYKSTGEKVVLVGENYLPNLSVGAQSKCQLANGGNIYIPNNDIDETLDNWSVIGVTRKLAAGKTNSFFKARATILPTSTIDSLRVSTYGHQVPSTFANAVRTWWRINRIPRTGSPSVASFTMYYSQEELAQNTESSLQVYYSADSGKSWQQVSTTLNMTRNGTDNYVAITDVASSGDYVLSSNPDPVSVRPSIMATVIGRSQIRVGAPNRFTIQYVNNSDFPTDDFLLSVNTGPSVGMDRSEHLLSNGTKETLTKDSLSFDTGDTSYVYYVTAMQPRESRQFDVVATAYPGLRKTAFFDPFSITVGTVVIWGAKAAATYAIVKTIDYLGDKGRQGLQFTPQQKRDWESTVGKIPEEIRRTDTKKEWAMKKVSGTLIEKAMGLVGGTVEVGKAVGRNIAGIVPNLRRQIWYWLYKETGLYGVEEQTEDASYKAEVSNASSKTGQPVTSWDPNEKVGPAGFGSQGFISTLGKMNYQILFENKKEATAPAYKVVIVDTLRSEFDPSTVEFGKTSHDDPQYVWKMTRTNNILRWEIEGIELPPNVVPPAGEGYVTFSVMPVNVLASGTALRNSATITFDMNKPIATNTFVNTIDFLPPATVMRPLPSTYNKQNLTVKWLSSDGATGSGVQSVSIFASKDGGPFQAVGSSLTDSLTIKIVNGAYKFYALATDNVGNSELARPALVQTTASGVVDVEKEPELPLAFVLEQNYPNPFNPTTEIAFSLSTKVRATVRIYDMLGREIATLIDDEMNPGKYTVKWDAGRHASGIYFYQLIAGDFVRTRKLVLLK